MLREGEMFSCCSSQRLHNRMQGSHKRLHQTVEHRWRQSHHNILAACRLSVNSTCAWVHKNSVMILMILTDLIKKSKSCDSETKR